MSSNYVPRVLDAAHSVPEMNQVLEEAAHERYRCAVAAVPHQLDKYAFRIMLSDGGV